MSFGIDLLRHLLCVAVISLHMTSPTRYSAATNAALQAFNGCWAVGAVFGFFLISGYLCKDQPLTPRFARQRASRLLVPYALFSLVYLVLLSAIGKLGGGLWPAFAGIFVLESPGMQLYFLPFLFLVTMAFCAVGAASTRRPVALGLAIATSLAVALCLPTSACTGPDWRLLAMYFLAFATGNLLKRADAAKRPHVVYAVVIAAAVALGMHDARFLHLGAMVATFLAVKALSGALPDHRLPGSGGVYMLHTPIVNFCVSTVLDRVSIQQVPNVILSVAITYVLCLGFTLLVVRRAGGWAWLLLEEGRGGGRDFRGPRAHARG